MSTARRGGQPSGGQGGDGIGRAGCHPGRWRRGAGRPETGAHPVRIDGALLHRGVHPPAVPGHHGVRTAPSTVPATAARSTPVPAPWWPARPPAPLAAGAGDRQGRAGGAVMSTPTPPPPGWQPPGWQPAGPYVSPPGISAAPAARPRRSTPTRPFSCASPAGLRLAPVPGGDARPAATQQQSPMYPASCRARRAGAGRVDLGPGGPSSRR